MEPVPLKYRTTNWKAYNAALKARGSLLIWVDLAVNWHGQASGKRGRGPTFSDEAIQFCLSIKCLFSLPLRQAMGMAQSPLGMAGLDWSVPDYSTVSRRQKTLKFAIEVASTTTGRPWCKLIGEAKNALFLSLLIKRRARHSILPALRSL